MTENISGATDKYSVLHEVLDEARERLRIAQDRVDAASLTHVSEDGGLNLLLEDRNTKRKRVAELEVLIENSQRAP